MRKQCCSLTDFRETFWVVAVFKRTGVLNSVTEQSYVRDNMAPLFYHLLQRICHTDFVLAHSSASPNNGQYNDGFKDEPS